MEENCKHEATEADIRLVIEQPILEKYHKFTLNLAISGLEGIFWCPTPECGYALTIEGNISDF